MNAKMFSLSLLAVPLAIAPMQPEPKTISSATILQCLPDSIAEFNATPKPTISDGKTDHYVTKYYKSANCLFMVLHVVGWNDETPHNQSEDGGSQGISINGRKAQITIPNENQVRLFMPITPHLSMSISIDTTLDASIPLRIARALDIECLASLESSAEQQSKKSGYVIVPMPNGSMEPNISYKKQVKLDPNAYKSDPVARFDVVAVEDPNIPGTVYIKRIIGLGGETLTIRGGVIYINDKALDEPFDRKVKSESFGPFKIPDGEFFVLGDDRRASWDSRSWEIKTVTPSHIKGRLVNK